MTKEEAYNVIVECAILAGNLLSNIDYTRVAIHYVNNPNRKIKFSDDNITCQHNSLSKFTDGKYRCDKCDKVISI
jgi:hypothetical protein